MLGFTRNSVNYPGCPGLGGRFLPCVQTAAGVWGYCWGYRVDMPHCNVWLIYRAFYLLSSPRVAYCYSYNMLVDVVSLQLITAMSGLRYLKPASNLLLFTFANECPPPQPPPSQDNPILLHPLQPPSTQSLLPKLLNSNPNKPGHNCWYRANHEVVQKKAGEFPGPEFLQHTSAAEVLSLCRWK